MAKTKTSKPCPQCGGTMHRGLGETTDRLGPWPAVCHRCRDYIEKGKAAEQRDKTRESFEEFNLPLGSNWPLRNPAQDQTVGEHVQAIRTSLSAAVVAIAEPALRQDGYGGDVTRYVPFHESHSHWRRVLISPEAADLLRTLHERLQGGLDQIFLAGVAEGQNLLKQLATGSISAEAFDSVERPRPPGPRRRRR